MKTRLLLVIMVSLIGYSCEDATAHEIEVVTVAEMETHLKYDNLQVLDVRSQGEYNKSHIMRAKNIIYDEDFRKNLENLDRNEPVAIYCTSGTVSPEAAKILQDAGFKHIYILEGGIKKWQDEQSGLNTK